MTHKRLLTAVDEINRAEEDSQRFRTLDDFLDILDGKANALLAFNGIMVASFAILAGGAEHYALKILSTLAMIRPLIACLMCFWVTSIVWASLSAHPLSNRQIPDFKEVVSGISHSPGPLGTRDPAGTDPSRLEIA